MFCEKTVKDVPEDTVPYLQLCLFKKPLSECNSDLKQIDHNTYHKHFVSAPYGDKYSVRH